MKRTNNGTGSPKMSAAEMTALTRTVAEAWVEREQRKTGSRMTAYGVVAKQVGASPSWLRKFIKGNEAKQPDWTVGWNLLGAYRRVCDRIAAEAEHETVLAQILERKLDAIVSGNLGLVARAPAATAHGDEDQTA